MTKKFYYARHITTGNDGRDRERDVFYVLLKNIQDRAVKTDTLMGGFFDEITYTLDNGEKWLYMYDVENGIPYSLELLKK